MKIDKDLTKVSNYYAIKAQESLKKSRFALDIDMNLANVMKYTVAWQQAELHKAIDRFFEDENEDQTS